MKFLKGLLVVVVILVIAIVIMGVSADSEYRVERTVKIDACYGDIYTKIADFHSWNEWSPWAKNDPGCEYSYEGEMAAIGMKSIWNGDPDVTGSGSMTCTEISEAGIVFDLDFITPHESSSTGSMTMEKVDDGIIVTWTSYGEFNGLMEKIFMGVFMDMDEMMGPMFEQGLGDLKILAEAEPRSDFEPGSMEMEEFHYIGKKMEMNVADLSPEVYASAFGEIYGYMLEAGAAPHETMKSMTVWHEYDKETLDGVFEIAVPVSATVEAREGLTVGTVATGSCMVGEHIGSYDTSGDMWEKMEGYTDCNRVELDGYPIEMYMSGPADGELDPNNWVTHIIYPLAAMDSDDGHDHDEEDHHHHDGDEGDHDHEDGDEGHGDDHDHEDDSEEGEDNAG